MFRVLTCLATEHDLRLVGLAGLVCFLASFAAISLFHRAGAAHGRGRAMWIMTAGTATGCGIWATHFIAMLAYDPGVVDRKSTRLNSSHSSISYAVFCLKKKKKK